jgi:peptidyl-prolyl cis-trans isomerase D
MEVEVSDEEIAEYYDQNQDNYIREEQVSIHYLVVDRNVIAEEIDVTDEEVRARYDEQRAELEAQTERRASHILLVASGQDEINEALVQANELKSRIDNGESFDDLAAEFSDDGGSAPYGGDIGYSTGNNFPEQVEAALKELDVDEVAEPVVSDFGVHIVKLTELNAVEIEPFEALAEQIKSDLQSEQSEALYLERMEELANLAFESFDLETPAAELGLDINVTDLFSRQGGTGVAATTAFINAAFSPEVLEDDLNSDLITISEDISVVLHLNEYLPPEIRPLDEVRVQVELELRQQKVTEMVESQGEELLTALDAGEDITAQLESLELSWTEREDVARDNTELSSDVLSWLFSLPSPAEGETVREGTLLNPTVYIIAEILNSTPGSLDDLEEIERQSLSAYIFQQSGRDDRANLMDNLINQAKITRND